MKQYTFLLVVFVFLFSSLNAMEQNEAEPIQAEKKDFPLKYLDSSKYDQAQKHFTMGPPSLTHFASEQVAANIVSVGKHISGETLDEFATEIVEESNRLPTELHPLVTQQFFLHCFENGWNVNYAKPKVPAKQQKEYAVRREHIYFLGRPEEPTLIIKKNQSEIDNNNEEIVPQKFTFEHDIRKFELSPDKQLLVVRLEDRSIHFFQNNGNEWSKVELEEHNQNIRNNCFFTFLNNTTCISSSPQNPNNPSEDHFINIWEKNNNQIQCTQKPVFGAARQMVPASPNENQFFIKTYGNQLYFFRKVKNEWTVEQPKTGPLGGLEEFKKSSNPQHYAAKIHPALTITELRLAQQNHPELNLYDVQQFKKVLVWENKGGKVELVKAINLGERGLHLVDFEYGIATLGKMKDGYHEPLFKKTKRTCINSDGEIVAKRKFTFDHSNFDHSNQEGIVSPYLSLIDTNPPLPAILASVALSNSRNNIEQLQALANSNTMKNLPDTYKRQMDEEIEKNTLKKLVTS